MVAMEAMQRRERRPNPRNIPVPGGKCPGCRVNQALAPETLCAECAADWQAHLEHEAALEQSYQEARAARMSQQQEEYEEWRMKRYQERLAEQQAYEELKAERQSARIEEENRDWYDLLARLGGR